ncbi:MAG: PAS domain S-box protein [Elusimicrobia bacterium]|nr:PAS domain S-box protein [Candidatus Liberimonas magnetica]
MNLAIRTKLFLTGIVLTILATSFLGWFSVHHEKKGLEIELSERVNSLVDNLAMNCVYGVLTLNKEELNRLASNVLSQKDIVFVKVEDDKGITLVNAGKEPADEPIKEFSTAILGENQTANTGEEMLLNIEGKSEKEKIGKVKVAISLVSFNDKLNELRKIMLIVSLAIILFVIVAVTLIVNTYINSPIKNLISATKIIAQGNLDYEVKSRSKDELGILSNFFNKMTKDLKKSKEALEERARELNKSEKRFKDIAFSMADWIWEVDEKGVYTFCSNQVEDILGYTEKELIGKTPFDLMLPKEAERIGKIFSEIIKNKEPIKDLENWNLSKNGIQVCLLTNGVPLLDEQGNIKGYRGIDKDITEHKQAEKEKEKFQRQLMQADKMSAIGQLAGGVAHEINNPMGVILGFAQVVANDIKENDPLYMPLKSIEREALRCKKLVGDLLTFSRAGKTEKENTNINETIEETISIIDAQAKVKNVKITRSYAANLPHIVVNKNQIQQVIVNLCNNAMDAMPQGGKITITTRQVETRIEIDVSDTGTGMTEDVKKHIFEPFFTTKEIGKGTGLGLSLCFEIIENHSGTIEAESEAGKGSVFRIKLPIN